MADARHVRSNNSVRPIHSQPIAGKYGRQKRPQVSVPKAAARLTLLCAIIAMRSAASRSEGLRLYACAGASAREQRNVGKPTAHHLLRGQSVVMRATAEAIPNFPDRKGCSEATTNALPGSRMRHCSASGQRSTDEYNIGHLLVFAVGTMHVWPIVICRAGTLCKGGCRTAHSTRSRKNHNASESRPC